MSQSISDYVYTEDGGVVKLKPNDIVYMIIENKKVKAKVISGKANGVKVDCLVELPKKEIIS